MVQEVTVPGEYPSSRSSTTNITKTPQTGQARRPTMGTDPRLPIVFTRMKARLKKVPTGSLQVINVAPGDVDRAIQQWDKLGYDLHDRSQLDNEEFGIHTRIEEHVILTFVKR